MKEVDIGEEPTFDEVVAAVLQDGSFRIAVGDGERAAAIAEAAVRAALIFIGLSALARDVQHEVGGHG